MWQPLSAALLERSTGSTGPGTFFARGAGMETPSGQQQSLVPSIVVCFVCLVLAWISTVLRISTRGFVSRQLWWDDYTIVIALILFTVLTSLALSIGYLFQLHLTTSFTTDSITLGANLLIAADVFYISTIMVFKISLALFFIRFTTAAWQRYLVVSVVSVTTLYSVAYLMVAIFPCGYSKNPWEMFERKTEGKCLPEQTALALTYVHAILTSSTDWMFALLPLVMLHNLMLSMQAKATIWMILALGAAGSICSLVRLKYIHILVDSQKIFSQPADFVLWAVLECGIGIFANSLATLRPLLQLFGRMTVAPDMGKKSYMTSGTGTSQLQQRMQQRKSQGFSRIMASPVMSGSGWGEPVVEFEMTDTKRAGAKVGFDEGRDDKSGLESKGIGLNIACVEVAGGEEKPLSLHEQLERIQQQRVEQRMQQRGSTEERRSTSTRPQQLPVVQQQCDPWQEVEIPERTSSLYDNLQQARQQQLQQHQQPQYHYIQQQQQQHQQIQHQQPQYQQSQHQQSDEEPRRPSLLESLQQVQQQRSEQQLLEQQQYQEEMQRRHQQWMLQQYEAQRRQGGLEVIEE